MLVCHKSCTRFRSELKQRLWKRCKAINGYICAVDSPGPTYRSDVAGEVRRKIAGDDRTFPWLRCIFRRGFLFTIRGQLLKPVRSEF